MKTSIALAVSLGVTATLGGCATLPPTPGEQGISVETIVDAVQCELREAYRTFAKRGRTLDRLAALADMELKVVDDSSAGTTGTAIVLVTDGTFTPSIGLGATGRATRTAKLQFAVDMKELGPSTYDYCKAYPDTGLPEAPSRLGLARWIEEGYGAFEQTDVAQYRKLVYEIEFVVTVSANGGFALAVVRGTAGLTAGVSRQNTHLLTIALAPKVEPEGPLAVTIVGPVRVVGSGTPPDAEPRFAPPLRAPSVVPPKAERDPGRPRAGVRRPGRAVVPLGRPAGTTLNRETIRELERLIQDQRPQRIRITP
jgi:hypothetical protein